MWRFEDGKISKVEGITSYNIDQIKIGEQGTNDEVSDTTDDDQGTVAGSIT